MGHSSCRRTVSYSEFVIGGETTAANNLAAMRRAIEAAGVWLVFDRKGTPGILRQDADADLSGEAPT
jgi:hypothetical protein